MDFGGKTVIDAGASIVGSAIFFSINGAEQVVSLEPYPKTYKIAQRNISANKNGSNIILLNAGIAGENGTMALDQHSDTTMSTSLHMAKKGQEVKADFA